MPSTPASTPATGSSGWWPVPNGTDRAIAENRAVSPSLIQPVRAEMLQTV
ncbi:hypothetical protein [Fodinicola feengrottensis]|nr:hypothetical protein [Fodinicola feengrottensis]